MKKVFYFERATGKRVSESTWKRSLAQGGTRFVRRSASSTPKGERKESISKGRTRSLGGSAPTQEKSSPSNQPRTYQEWQKYFQSLPKRKRRAIEESEGYEGPEYETGVDY